MLAERYHRLSREGGPLNVCAMAVMTIAIVAGFYIVYSTAEQYNSHMPVASAGPVGVPSLAPAERAHRE